MSMILSATPENISLAATYLQKGRLVGLPTETVYGLAAAANQPEALARIFKAKTRPIQHPLIVHLGDITELSQWAIDIPDFAYQLAEAFWPGPLTLVLKKHPEVSDIVTGGQDSIGIRIPAHPVMLAVLQQAKLAVAAPSANRHCHVSPTSATDVLEELGDNVDLIIDGGTCDVGIESTILNLTSETLEILRPGIISAAMISQVLNQAIGLKRTTQSPRVSGDLLKHYAPDKPAILVKAIDATQLHAQQMVMALTAAPKNCLSRWYGMAADPKQYAHDLYRLLREFDHSAATELLIEMPPDQPEWAAVLDRLRRAAISQSSS